MAEKFVIAPQIVVYKNIFKLIFLFIIIYFGFYLYLYFDNLEQCMNGVNSLQWYLGQTTIEKTVKVSDPVPPLTETNSTSVAVDKKTENTPPTKTEGNAVKKTSSKKKMLKADVKPVVY